MTLDGFLTFLAIVVAVYAVMPSVTRVRIALRKRSLALASIVALALVIYLEFFSVLGQPCPAGLGTWCPYLSFRPGGPTSPQQMAFVVALWLVFAGITFTRIKLAPRSIPILSRLVAELVHQRKFADLLDLLEPHVSLLSQTANRQTRTAKLHDRFFELDPLSGSPQQILARLQSRQSIEKNISWFDRLKRTLLRYVSKLSYMIPSQNLSQESAEEMLRVLFTDPDILSFVSRYRPKFGVKLLAIEAWGVKDFASSFLKSQMRASDSLLYREIAANQNTAVCGYAFPEHNKMLYFLFSDANEAERLSIWKPVGDEILATLNSDRCPQYISSLNYSCDDFFENGRFQDKVFVGLSFFDLMVSSAACQGIQYHMWLYYYPDILEQLVDLYDASGQGVDENSEWPTRGAYLIYELFSHVLGWSEMIKDLPDDSPHKQMENVQVRHENDNIPKSAAIALGTCMKRFLGADNVGLSFQRYIHDIALRHISDVSKNGSAGQLRQVLISSMIQGGMGAADEQYGDELKQLWGLTDHVLRAKLQDYETALINTYG